MWELMHQEAEEEGRGEGGGGRKVYKKDHGALWEMVLQPHLEDLEKK